MRQVRPATRSPRPPESGPISPVRVMRILTLRDIVDLREALCIRRARGDTCEGSPDETDQLCCAGS